MKQEITILAILISWIICSCFTSKFNVNTNRFIWTIGNLVQQLDSSVGIENTVLPDSRQNSELEISANIEPNDIKFDAPFASPEIMLLTDTFIFTPTICPFFSNQGPFNPEQWHCPGFESWATWTFVCVLLIVSLLQAFHLYYFKLKNSLIENEMRNYKKKQWKYSTPRVNRWTCSTFLNIFSVKKRIYF